MIDYNITYREKDKGIQVIVSYKEGKKWKQKSKQGFENSRQGKKEARAWAQETIETLKNEINLNKDYSEITFDEFFNIYIEDRKINLSDHTIKTFRTAYDKFKSLGNSKLNEIRTIDIQRCVNVMVETGLKSSTIETNLCRLKTIFYSAINNYNIITSNPAKNIEYPKIQPDEKIALTSTEVSTLLSKLQSGRNRDVYITSLIAVKCGLRIGEILGLTWSDINFTEKSIEINKQWNLDDGIYKFTTPKNNNAYRTVYFSDFVKKELLNFKNSAPISISNRILDIYNNESFGSTLRYNYKKYGFNISVHNLRHTYATNLIKNGLDFKTAAHLLGHDIKQTMKTYSHVNSDMLNIAKSIIDYI